MRRIFPILICLMATKMFATIPTFGSFDTNTLNADPPGNI